MTQLYVPFNNEIKKIQYSGFVDVCLMGMAFGAIDSGVIEIFINKSRTCVFFSESLTCSDAVGVVIPRKSPSNN